LEFAVKEFLQAKFDEPENSSKINNIIGFYRGIIEFNNGYWPRTNILKIGKLICLQTPTVFCIYGGIISLSY
jgi:hypothetical protein